VAPVPPFRIGKGFVKARLTVLGEGVVAMIGAVAVTFKGAAVDAVRTYVLGAGVATIRFEFAEVIEGGAAVVVVSTYVLGAGVATTVFAFDEVIEGGAAVDAETTKTPGEGVATATFAPACTLTATPGVGHAPE
jgi:hypothetical protein